MKNKVIQSIVVALALLSGAFAHAINVKYIKGTYEVLKPEYRHLSPVHGAVWWEKGLAQKYYKFGFYGKSIPKTKGIAHPPYGTVALIRDLFHEVQGSFNVTKSPSSTAFHFSPETVAKVLAIIEKYKDQPVSKIEKVLVKKKGKNIQAKKRVGLVDELRNVIKVDTDFQASIQKYMPKYQELSAKIKIANKKDSELKKNFLVLISEKKRLENKPRPYTKEDTLALAEIEDKMEALTNQMASITQIKKEYGQYNIKDAQGRKLNILTNALVASLQECGFVQSDKISYPKEITHSVLLAFLYRKADEKSEFKNYFDELTNVLKKQVLTEQGVQQVAAQQWITDAFDDSKEGIEKVLAEIKKVTETNKTLKEILNKISLAKIVFGEVSRPQALPHMAEYADVFFNKVKFSDCAETTMRNLSNIATYNANNNTFDIGKFKNADPEIKKFYTAYSNAAELEAQKIHQAWVPIIENRPFVAYHKIVAPNNPKKVAVAPQGTQGFMYGFKDEDIKKLNLEAVNISFNDGSSDALQKAKINDGEYIIIDPKQYYAFEARPSLRNTIILMNQFFGLELYKNLNTDFFKKDFNMTYFPELTKKFGWDYDSWGYKNIDTGDYGTPGLSIELETDTGEFLLNLESNRHGYVKTISAIKIEEYQKELFKLAQDGLIKDQGQTVAELLCLYTLSDIFVSNPVIFLQQFEDANLSYLSNYMCYVQNLNDPNTALAMIKKLIVLVKMFSQQKSTLLNLVAALIENLPIRQDLYYQKQVSKAIIENQAYENKDIKKTLDMIFIKIRKSEAPDKYVQFIQFITIFPEKVIQALKEGLLKDQSDYRHYGEIGRVIMTKLDNKLITQPAIINLFVTRGFEVLKDSQMTPIILLNNIKSVILRAFLLLLEKKLISSTDAAQAAKIGLLSEGKSDRQNPRNFAKDLFEGLFKQDKGFSVAIDAAKQGLQSNDENVKSAAKTLQWRLNQLGKWPKEEESK